MCGSLKGERRVAAFTVQKFTSFEQI